MKIKDLAYILVFSLIWLDVLTTLVCLYVLKLPIEQEMNLVFRFLFQNKLWDYIITITLMKILSGWYAVEFITYNINKTFVLAKKFCLVFFLGVLTFPVVNNAWIILHHIILQVSHNAI